MEKPKKATVLSARLERIFIKIKHNFTTSVDHFSQALGREDPFENLFLEATFYVFRGKV